jgi:hypothetical protein
MSVIKTNLKRYTPFAILFVNFTTSSGFTCVVIATETVGIKGIM